LPLFVLCGIIGNEVRKWLRIPYMVVGGFASIVYGQPRFTADVDIVLERRAVEKMKEGSE